MTKTCEVRGVKYDLKKGTLRPCEGCVAVSSNVLCGDLGDCDGDNIWVRADGAELKTFVVTMITRATVEVEASSEQEAMDLVEEMSFDGGLDPDVSYIVEEE